MTKTSYGAGDKQYWIFDPVQVLGPVPVIVFLHGWGLLDPTQYSIWIEHLVKRGNVVVFPKFQDNILELTPNMTPNAVSAVQSAFVTLGSRADRSRFAIVGHSIGASIAFDMSALAATAGLPAPTALMAAAPGGTTSFGWTGTGSLDQIPANILALVLIGDEDTTVGDETAKALFASIPQVACTNKNLLLVRSDRHGTPQLVASHAAPTAAAIGSNALDFYGYWKLSDALIGAAFYGSWRDYALGGGPNQTFMGTWSDGVPVAPLQIVRDGTCALP